MNDGYGHSINATGPAPKCGGPTKCAHCARGLAENMKDVEAGQGVGGLSMIWEAIAGLMIYRDHPMLSAPISTDLTDKRLVALENAVRELNPGLYLEGAKWWPNGQAAPAELKEGENNGSVPGK